MSSKSIFIITSYSVPKLARFLGDSVVCRSSSDTHYQWIGSEVVNKRLTTSWVTLVTGVVDCQLTTRDAVEMTDNSPADYSPTPAHGDTAHVLAPDHDTDDIL